MKTKRQKSNPTQDKNPVGAEMAHLTSSQSIRSSLSNPLWEWLRRNVSKVFCQISADPASFDHGHGQRGHPSSSYIANIFPIQQNLPPAVLGECSWLAAEVRTESIQPYLGVSASICLLISGLLFLRALNERLATERPGNSI